MHSNRWIWPFLLCLAGNSIAAPSAEVQKAAEALTSTLKDEMRAMEEAQDERGKEGVRQYLRQIQNAIARDTSREFDQMVEPMGNFDPSDKVLDGIAQLKKAARQSAEDRTRAALAELRNQIEAATEAVTLAQEPDDLDKTLLSLNRGRGNGNDDWESSDNPKVRAAVAEVRNARSFVASWQDYLQSSNSGNNYMAIQKLTNLLSMESMLIPRSQILKRLEFEQISEREMPQVLDAIKTLDDMNPAIRKLSRQSARFSSDSTSGLREAFQALVRMEKAYRDYLAGLPVRIEVLQQSNEMTDAVSAAKLSQLRASLLGLLLPRALDLPENLRPEANEPLDVFLNRAMADAKAREDFTGCLRIADMRQMLFRSANLSDKDVEALRSYAAGCSQAEAGQYFLSVLSLQGALKSGSEWVPAKKAGDLLERMRQEHAAEFSQAMTEFLTPRSAPEFDYSRMPYRGYPGSSRYPDGTGPGVLLPIPARDAANPAATPPAKAEPAKTEPVAPAATPAPAPDAAPAPEAPKPKP